MQGPSHTPNRRIIVIDDNPAIHADFSKILGEQTDVEKTLNRTETELFARSESRGFPQPVFEISGAFQGEEAIEMVKAAAATQCPFALAFVDIRMPPGLDGIETTSRLWQIDPELQVVICTAYSDYSWSEMIGKLGYSDRLVLLKKPFDPVEVLQLASALTEKWALKQATLRRMGDLETLVAQRTSHLEEANEELTREMSRRERREACLRLQKEVARLLANSAAPEAQLIRHVLMLICESMGWMLGRFWIADSRAGILRCTSELVLDSAPTTPSTDQSGRGILLTRLLGCGLAGHVWKTGRPLCISKGNPGLGETEPAEEAAGSDGTGQTYSAGLAFPLRLEGAITGVLEFRGHNNLDDDGTILQGLETIGGLVGHALERRKLEEQLRHSQKMEAIGHLAGGIAHDFNNILTVINGYAQLLKMKQSLPPDVTASVHQIGLAAERATLLTRQLLTFSRKQMMQPKALILNRFISQTEAMLRRMIGEDIALKFTPSATPAVVHGDEGMLSQVLMNLACNARDAMPEGGALTLKTETLTLDNLEAQHCAEARPGEFVCLSVEDTGCGIKTEDLPRIFEPFFTTKDVGRGTGLGLCTVYGIVKQHRGWIEVDSVIGVGTRFRIYLPRTLETLPTKGTEFFHRPSKGQGETILLVEDETPVRNLAGEVLRSHGYHVLEAGSGTEALSVWNSRAGDIDMLLTDIVMPDGLSGRDLAARLRGSRSDLPVLLVSGYNPAESNAEDSLNQVHFLPKPYTPEKLVHSVRSCLDSGVRAVPEPVSSARN